MDVYAENILDHYRNPRGTCDITATDFAIQHKESNPTCGDTITIGLTIKDGVIQKIGWQGSGCAISQAAMSLLYEEFHHAPVDVVLDVSKDDILELLGVPVSNRRLNCALLGLKALQKALSSTDT